MESNCLPCKALSPHSVHIERHIQSIIPFHHLSVSNLPPTEPELSGIQVALLPALDQDIMVVESAVTAARRALESLEQERDALENIKQKLKNIISIRRRIPPEIWSEIFLHSHHMDSVGRDEMFNWSSRTIWQLSQVCQTWRNSAFSLHSCWTNIVLDFSSSWPASQKDADLLSFILERSAQHLLDITLIHQSVEDLPLPNRMPEMIFAESYRWRSARLLNCYQVKSDLLYAPLRGRLPQMELLHFQCVGGMTAVVSAFQDCPRLIKVALTGVDPRKVELPVQHIACLHLLDHLPYWRIEDFEVYLQLISQCPLLEILRVDLTKRTHDPSLRSVTLPRARNLRATYPYLLDSLVLPQLEVAVLDEKLSTFNAETLFSFYSLIRRSNCASNLVDLRITGVSLALHPSEPHLLLAILSYTTALATLQLKASMIDRRDHTADAWRVTQIMDVMKALNVAPGQTVTFLPRLVSLDLKISDHTHMEDVPYLRPFDKFVSMLKVRRAGNQDGLFKLKRFRFRLGTGYLVDHPDAHQHQHLDQPVFDDHEIAVLRGLAGDGMSLDIRFEGVLSFTLREGVKGNGQFLS